MPTNTRALSCSVTTGSLKRGGQGKKAGLNQEEEAEDDDDEDDDDEDDDDRNGDDSHDDNDVGPQRLSGGPWPPAGLQRSPRRPREKDDDENGDDDDDQNGDDSHDDDVVVGPRASVRRPPAPGRPPEASPATPGARNVMSPGGGSGAGNGRYREK